MISSVAAGTQQITDALSAHLQVLMLDGNTPLPFRNAYATPQTLGADRIAAAAGAQKRFPNESCLSIDCGTCITYDMLSSGTYLGGSISPGLQMRLKAMHQFTGRLPLPAFSEPADFIGNNTESNLLSGAFFGVVNEINETVARYTERFGTLRVLICGGDALLFEKHLKSNIFAAPYLVLEGLNQILKFNVSKSL